MQKTQAKIECGNSAKTGVSQQTRQQNLYCITTWNEKLLCVLFNGLPITLRLRVIVSNRKNEKSFKANYLLLRHNEYQILSLLVFLLRMQFDVFETVQQK